MRKPFSTFTMAGMIAGAMMLSLASGAAFANNEIVQASKNPNLWPAPGRDLGMTRHSPLKDINTGNVGRLQMMWSQSTGALRGHQGQPIVIEVDSKPMMFFVSPWPNIVQALDLSDPDNPKQVWNYKMSGSTAATTTHCSG